MRPFLLLAALLVGTGCGPESRTPDDLLPVRVREGVSPTFHITQKYRSMEGPAAATMFPLSQGPRELLWITSYRTEVVGEDGEPAPGLREFMCHNNMDFEPAVHHQVFGLERPIQTNRMFTASQGVFEVVFPPGYGMPVLSDEPFSVHTMVLNHNREDPDVKVRHRVRVEYVRDEDARGRLKPLYTSTAPVMALVSGEDGYYQVEGGPSHDQAGAECSPGLVAPNAVDHVRTFSDDQGRVFTQHWVVPPGREERRTLVTELLNLPFDTTVHTIAAHLHPYAESMSLRDLTTDETLFTVRPEAPEEGVGLARVENYSSAEGIPVFRDHEYEVVSVYDNPTDVDQDAMAVFFLYYYDEEMDRQLDSVRARLQEESAGS